MFYSKQLKWANYAIKTSLSNNKFSTNFKLRFTWIKWSPWYFCCTKIPKLKNQNGRTQLNCSVRHISILCYVAKYYDKALDRTTFSIFEKKIFTQIIVRHTGKNRAGIKPVTFTSLIKNKMNRKSILSCYLHDVWSQPSITYNRYY